jgi:hypothetical protein
VEGGFELGALLLVFGDGFDEGEHLVGRLGTDEGRDGVLFYGDAEG